jgi:hypothetical protein
MGSITDILVNLKSAIPELINNSVAAIFNKIAEALSITIDNTIKELANTETIINANIAANNYGKSGYYINAALQYEDGIDMVIDPITLNWIYDPVDVSKQTISQAAFDEANLILKVAYIDPDTNLLAKLPTDILNRFRDYFNTSGLGGFGIPGIPIQIISSDPNIFNCSSFVVTFYGSYSLVNIQADVEAALIAFRDGFQYNGIFYLNDLTDYLKANVSGIRDVSITGPEIDGTGFSGSTILSSGYFNFDGALSITYNAI